MIEYIDEVEFWKAKALEMQLRAIKAEADAVSAALQVHADAVFTKYGMIKNVDRLEEDGGKFKIVRAPKHDEAVK